MVPLTKPRNWSSQMFSSLWVPSFLSTLIQLLIRSLHSLTYFCWLRISPHYPKDWQQPILPTLACSLTRLLGSSHPYILSFSLGHHKPDYMILLPWNPFFPVFPAPLWGKIKALCSEDPPFQAPTDLSSSSPITCHISLWLWDWWFPTGGHCALFCGFITCSCLATHFNMPANYFRLN